MNKMEDLRERLAYEIRRARFNIHLPQLNPEFMQSQLDWLNNRKRSAKKRDLNSLDNALRPGAYPGASLIEEIMHRKGYIKDVCEKYGEGNPEVIAVLEKYDVDEILEAGELLEDIVALPTKVKERAENLADFWEREGVELDAFEWLEVADRVERGDEIREILSEYGYDFEC